MPPMLMSMVGGGGGRPVMSTTRLRACTGDVEDGGGWRLAAGGSESSDVQYLTR